MVKVRIRKKMDWYSLMLDDQFERVYLVYLDMLKEFQNRPLYSLKFKNHKAIHLVEKKLISDNRLAYCAFRRLFSNKALNELRDQYGVL